MFYAAGKSVAFRLAYSQGTSQQHPAGTLRSAAAVALAAFTYGSVAASAVSALAQAFVFFWRLC